MCNYISVCVAGYMILALERQTPSSTTVFKSARVLPAITSTSVHYFLIALNFLADYGKRFALKRKEKKKEGIAQFLISSIRK